MSVVVRPRNMRKTPRRLKDYLGFQRTYAYPNRQRLPVFSWNTDLLIAVPEGHHVRDAPAEFSTLRKLYASDKWKQRLWLHENGFPTPLQVEDANVYVRRPKRHHSGIGFECIDSESPIPLQELIAHNNVADTYLSPLFRRTQEYRIVMHKGQVVFTILKRNDAELDQTQAWNGANGSYFVTVRNPDNNRLRHTDCAERLINNPVLASAHLLGVDILYNSANNTYCIVEVNFAPSLTIESNLEEFKNHVEAR